MIIKIALAHMLLLSNSTCYILIIKWGLLRYLR